MASPLQRAGQEGFEDALRAEVELWERAEAIRRYCDAIESRHVVRESGYGKPAAEWTRRARAYADQIDPARRGPDVPPSGTSTPDECTPDECAPDIRPTQDPVELQTPRLLLRRFRLEDLDRLADWQSRPEVARFLYWGPRSRAEAEAALALRMAGRRLEQADDVVTLAVERREDEVLLGDVTIWLRSPEHRQVEIGYVFHPDASGHGYATEAARRLVDFAFDELAAHRVFARTDPSNTASAAVLRRLGMRQEAHLRESEIIKGEWADELTFALLARERKETDLP